MSKEADQKGDASSAAGKLRGLVEQVNSAGRDEELRAAAEKAIQEIIDDHPGFFMSVTGMVVTNQVSLINKMTDGREAERAMLKKECAALRDRLGYEGATPLEQTIIEQLVMCWLRLQHVEYVITHTSWDYVSVSLRNYWDKAHTRALRRYSQACETLAKVRHLMQPRGPRIQQIAVVSSDSEIGRRLTTGLAPGPGVDREE